MVGASLWSVVLLPISKITRAAAELLISNIHQEDCLAARYFQPELCLRRSDRVIDPA